MTTTSTTAALPIKTIPLLPKWEKESPKTSRVFPEPERAEAPQTEWEQKVGQLEEELAMLEADPHTTAVAYYKLFESLRGLISHAYAAYSDSTALTVVGRLETLKGAITPRITRV
jgi:hypothetical protein